MTGITADPWDIHWGGSSIGNTLLLYNIDEMIDYKAAYAGGHGVGVALLIPVVILVNWRRIEVDVIPERSDGS